jgi:methylmalonyl-CoA mutase N-terminal domain/subunit
MAEAIRSGWVQTEIDRALLLREEEIAAGNKTIVGVNAYRQPQEEATPGGLHVVPPGQGERLAAAVKSLRAQRDGEAVVRALAKLREAARAGPHHNLLPALVRAAKSYATIGEMLGTVRSALGYPYDPLGVLHEAGGLTA